MKSLKTHNLLAITATLLLACSSTLPANSVKLAAPVYPGAVPGVLADGIQVDPLYIGDFDGVKALDCRGTQKSFDIAGRTITAQEAEKAGNYRGPWCFLTRDPIDKVKAFYDKAIGPMHSIMGTWGKAPPEAVQGYAAYAERAWFPGEGEESAPGFGYTAVSLHALPPPGSPGKEAENTDDTWEGQEAFKFYSSSRHFNGFIEGVDWFGSPSKRKPEELRAVYEQHKRLESALYQRRGPKSEPQDEILRAGFTAEQKQGLEKAQTMMPGQGQKAQMMQLAQMPQEPAGQQGTPEDAEFNAFMQKNPKVAGRYVELTKRIGQLTMQGKFDEADAADEELQQLIDENPELAALERRAEERSAGISATNQAAENRAMENYNQQMDQAVWGTWMKYIDEAEKDAYYTLIVIDGAFRGDEKDYSRDYALVNEETAGWAPHQQVWDFQYTLDQGKQAAQPAAAETKSKSEPEKKETKGDTVKKGLRGFKKVF